MRSLREAIAALRNEIEQGLTAQRLGTTAPQITPDRVVVNLAFEAHEGTSAGDIEFRVPGGSNTTASRPFHSVTVEFRIQSTSNQPAAEGMETSAPIAALVLEGPTATRLQEQLATIFGPPGFDSSARATVFREALESLTPSDVQTLRGILLGKLTVEPGASIVHSLSLLDRVMKSGPSGIAHGRSTLVEILQRHNATQILDLVAKVWKTQEGWID